MVPNKINHKINHNIHLETEELLKSAENAYWDNFSGETWYGRCLFLSWYCNKGDCKFCFRSTQKHKIKHPENSRRSMGSLLLEALFCRLFNWRIEFLTGGYGIMPFNDLLVVIKNVCSVYGKKIWLNLGVLTGEELEMCRPYVKGICASMETLNPKLHAEVCPSKPIPPYEEMFKNMKSFKKSICVIVGLGENIEEITYLFDFIEKHALDRITIYALKPVRGTAFTDGPSTDEFLQWIAKVRIRFPQLEIIAGTNLKRYEEVGYLMKAGSNAITKFPATKQFATEKAKKVEELIKGEKRNFISNLTVLPDIDWNKEIDCLKIDETYKKEMKNKLYLYLSRLRKAEI